MCIHFMSDLCNAFYSFMNLCRTWKQTEWIVFTLDQFVCHLKTYLNIKFYFYFIIFLLQTVIKALLINQSDHCTVYFSCFVVVA